MTVWPHRLCRERGLHFCIKLRPYRQVNLYSLLRFVKDLCGARFLAFWLNGLLWVVVHISFLPMHLEFPLCRSKWLLLICKQLLVIFLFHHAVDCRTVLNISDVILTLPFLPSSFLFFSDPTLVLMRTFDMNSSVMVFFVLLIKHPSSRAGFNFPKLPVNILVVAGESNVSNRESTYI